MQRRLDLGFRVRHSRRLMATALLPTKPPRCDSCSSLLQELQVRVYASWILGLIDLLQELYFGEADKDKILSTLEV